MALIQCPDCKREVSDAAPNCPTCGRPLERKRDNATIGDAVVGAGKAVWSIPLIAVILVVAFPFLCFASYHKLSEIAGDAWAVLLCLPATVAIEAALIALYFWLKRNVPH